MKNIVVYFENVSEDVGIVTMLDMVEQSVVDRKIQRIVKEVPQSEDRFGKFARMCIDLNNDILYYEYINRPLTPEEQLQQRIELMQQALDELLLGGI